MNNPWKQYSKLNPQREEGNRQIATDVFHSLMSVNLSGAEFRIVMTIIDKTWGFNKETDCISVSQFIQATGIAERTIKDCLKNLKKKRIIFYESSNIRGRCGSPLNEFLFNKHYDTWKPQGCGNLHACKKTSNKGAEKRILRVSKTAHTKEIITKESITKEKPKKLAVEKIKFKDSVFLTQEEIEKLQSRFSNGNFERAIEILNNYKMSSGKKYKSDYHALIGWVSDRLTTVKQTYDPFKGAL